MANLTPVNSFDNVVQLETNTVALGGVGGPMNAQAQALLNRTAYLKGVYNALTGMIGAVEGNGIAPLVNGKVPSANLPGYVDDVLEYANLASFPLPGEASKLYIAIDTNLVYRWSGSTYAVTSSSLALGETSTTAYYGNKGKTAYDHSQATGNPHNLPLADGTNAGVSLNNYTSAEKTKLAGISGTNTGDETTERIKTKLGVADTDTDGYLTSTDWNTFNGKLGLADVRYVFLNDSTTSLTTYTVPASAVTEVGRTIIELSNNSLTSITINAATGTGKSVGDSVNICVTGDYNDQVLVGSGATLQGDLTFSYKDHTKTLVYKGSNVWKIVG